MLMNDLIKMRIFELLSEASQEVTNDELQNAYGELLEHIRCVSSGYYQRSFQFSFPSIRKRRDWPDRSCSGWRSHKSVNVG